MTPANAHAPNNIITNNHSNINSDNGDNYIIVNLSKENGHRKFHREATEAEIKEDENKHCIFIW